MARTVHEMFDVAEEVTTEESVLPSDRR